MKAVVAAFNQEKALVGAFSVITNLRMELFQGLVLRSYSVSALSHQSAQHEVSGKEVHAHGGDEKDEGEDDGEVLEEVAGDVADDEEEHEVLEEEEGVLQVAEQGVGLQDEETRVEAVAVNMNDLDDMADSGHLLRKQLF